MASELELKAVVEEPARVRAALAAAGAIPVFRGLLRDTRLDAAGALTGRDQVLRLRRWIPDEGAEAAELAWKGPTSVNPAGYKHREELEVGLAPFERALALEERPHRPAEIPEDLVEAEVVAVDDPAGGRGVGREELVA